MTPTRHAANITYISGHRPERQGVLSALTSAVDHARARLAPLDVEPRTAERLSPASSAVQRSVRASAFDLEQYAWTKCAALQSDGDATLSTEAAASMRGVLRRFVRDNGPTPQVGPTPERTLEIQWLAAGTCMSVLFEESGDYNLYAIGPDRNVLFDVDVEAGEGPSEQVELEAASVLAGMARRVNVRPQSFWG